MFIPRPRSDVLSAGDFAGGDSGVQQLIQAMAGFDPTPMAETSAAQAVTGGSFLPLAANPNPQRT